MKNLLLLLLIFTLTACTTYTAQTGIAENGMPLGRHYLSWPQRHQQLSNVTAWDAQGAIAIRNDKQGWNASFAWQQQYNNYILELFGPLGTNRVQITSNPTSTTLETAQHTYTATNAEALLQQQYGYDLPVSSLHYWLRGLPVPGVRSHQAYDTNNHIAQMSQQGWRIMYLRYLAIGNIDLPDRILLIKQPWVVHVVIHNWQLK